MLRTVISFGHPSKAQTSTDFNNMHLQTSNPKASSYEPGTQKTSIDFLDLSGV
jgi:hypothetical protein